MPSAVNGQTEKIKHFRVYVCLYEESTINTCKVCVVEPNYRRTSDTKVFADQLEQSTNYKYMQSICG
jgi:hypothetical protein